MVSFTQSAEVFTLEKQDFRPTVRHNVIDFLGQRKMPTLCLALCAKRLVPEHLNPQAPDGMAPPCSRIQVVPCVYTTLRRKSPFLAMHRAGLS